LKIINFSGILNKILESFFSQLIVELTVKSFSLNDKVMVEGFEKRGYQEILKKNF
jgi:hypothetical protein